MYLFVPKSQRQLPDHPRVRCLVTPDNGAIPGSDLWGDYNGAFTDFNPGRFRAMLERLDPVGCRFVTVPDVVADDRATRARWRRWAGLIERHGFPVGFVAQDGCRQVPGDADALFIGGTTRFKLSDDARRLIDDRWCHMGRVNSYRRLRLAAAWGVYSVDGFSMAAFTDTKIPGYLTATEYRQEVFAI